VIEHVYILPKFAPRCPLADRVADLINNLPADKAWRVVVKETRPHRSDAQNNYLHGVCYQTISDAIGYEKHEVEEFLLGTYFGWKETRVPKKPSNPEGIDSKPIRRTTTNEHGERDVLSKTAFAEYVAFIQRFAASKGVIIEDPPA
jgi:hypothetical protein